MSVFTRIRLNDHTPNSKKKQQQYLGLTETQTFKRWTVLSLSVIQIV